MAKFVLLNPRIFAGGADLTGNTSKVELGAEVEVKTVVPSGVDGWVQVLGGVRSSELSASGQWEAGDPSKVDDALWAQLGSVGAWSILPSANQSAAASASVGSLAWITTALGSSYKLGGAVGDVAPWEAGGKSSWPLVRGLVGHPPGTARSATGDGTPQQHIAAAQGQYLYAALHVLSVAGTGTPTLTVRIDSDVDNTFSSPATVLTFAGATARGGQLLRAAGPITDTYYRVSWTISGTTPSFLFLVTFGVA